MKRLQLVLLMVMAFLPAAGGRKIELPVWDDKSETAGCDYEPVMYCYLPDRPNGVTVMMCPGGGYGHLAIGHEGHDMADWFNAQGITYVVLKYRLPVNHINYPMRDARKAMLNIRSRASEWNINPEKIGIMGGSAGGHLAASLSTDSDKGSIRPAFQILLYPVISMLDGLAQEGTRENLIGADATREVKELHSPELSADALTPKAFIVLSADDRCVAPVNSLLYFEALRKNGIPVSMHIYPTGDHGWGFRDSFKYKPEWTAELSKWLRECVEME